MVSAKVETTKKWRETCDRIKERHHQIEASIVHIVKDRKHFTHNDLVNKVTQQLASQWSQTVLALLQRMTLLFVDIEQYLSNSQSSAASSPT
ncbi:hypothetical protein EDB19DRAFT_1906994 [Suillus lakei]|nr:hypothetical protein EDB19DRAFT_1906994 [Suillus lakei]